MKAMKKMADNGIDYNNICITLTTDLDIAGWAGKLPDEYFIN